MSHTAWCVVAAVSILAIMWIIVKFTIRAKKLYWLLALTYVVNCAGKDRCIVEDLKGRQLTLVIPRESAEDTAAALNNSHDNRMEDTIPSLYWADPETQIKRPLQKKEFDYKSACGQDDCGAEPK